MTRRADRRAAKVSEEPFDCPVCDGDIDLAALRKERDALRALRAAVKKIAALRKESPGHARAWCQ